MAAESPPRCDCQNAYVTSATESVSLGARSRPSAGCAPSAAQKPGVVAAVPTRSDPAPLATRALDWKYAPAAWKLRCPASHARASGGLNRPCCHASLREGTLRQLTMVGFTFTICSG